MARSKDCCCWLTNPRQLLVTVKSLSLVILLSRVDKEEIKKKKKRKKSKGRQKEIDQVQSFQDQMRFACLLTQFVCNLIPSVSWQTFQGCLQLASINRWRFAGWLDGYYLWQWQRERQITQDNILILFVIRITTIYVAMSLPTIDLLD